MAKVKKDPEKPEDEGPSGPTRRWLKLGFELEGAWEDQDALVAAASCALHSDGSVTASCSGRYPYSGEVVCNKPYERLGPCLSAMKKLWPDVVNESCGFHVHVSFNTGDYQALTNSDFYAYYLKQWELWGTEILGAEGSRSCTEPEFWNRLRGRNRYCEARHRPEQQMDLTSKREARYAQLNYCWTLRKTIECRMLPMFKDREVAALAVKHLLWIYTSWLNAQPESSSDDALQTSPPGEPHRLVLEDGMDFLGANVSESDEIDVDYDQLPAGTAVVIQYKDTERTQRALASKLRKQYPDLVRAIQQLSAED